MVVGEVNDMISVPNSTCMICLNDQDLVVDGFKKRKNLHDQQNFQNEEAEGREVAFNLPPGAMIALSWNG